jgi:hypothetical protein
MSPSPVIGTRKLSVFEKPQDEDRTLDSFYYE